MHMIGLCVLENSMRGLPMIIIIINIIDCIALKIYDFSSVTLCIPTRQDAVDELHYSIYQVDFNWILCTDFFSEFQPKPCIRFLRTLWIKWSIGIHECVITLFVLCTNHDMNYGFIIKLSLTQCAINFHLNR